MFSKLNNVVMSRIYQAADNPTKINIVRVLEEDGVKHQIERPNAPGQMQVCPLCLVEAIGNAVNEEHEPEDVANEVRKHTIK